MTNRYSTIFDSKIPSFIKDDPSYTRFVEFFTAYYEWFDDTYNIMGLGDKLDIDAGFADFVDYFKQDFLPYFPDDIATDKVKLIKIAKELYKAKGIPDSFKFLFRALYNTHVDVFTTREYVLRASDGKWIVPKSIKIKSLDPNFLNINNFKVFGELSKTIGVVEKSKINGKFIQIYLSNIERVFYSGESIRILDNNNKDVYFLNGEYADYTGTPPQNAVLLSSKIIGSLSNIDISSSRRGQTYKVGYPVVITGGLNPDLSNPIGAIATISEVTAGQITKINVTDGGYGYRIGEKADVIYNGKVDTVANCIVSVVDDTRSMNVVNISTSYIGDNLLWHLGDSDFAFLNSANANTMLSDALTFTSFETYPIVDMLVKNGGGGYETLPTLEISSTFESNDDNTTKQNLIDLGILAPMIIENPGTHYIAGDKITITGGDGDFAYARVKSVGSVGDITAVEYYQDSLHPYPTGGMGYKLSNLPVATIVSATGVNGNVIIPSILGTGAKFNLETEKIGAITKITLSENGEDYISTPNVSLRIQDIVVTGVFGLNFTPTTIAYQGTLEIPTFIGSVDSVRNIDAGDPTIFTDDLFALRVYDYKGVVSGSTLNLYDTKTESSIGTVTYDSSYTNSVFTNGIKIYGDGSAKATAKFLNGVIVDSGRYLNSDGQLSAHSVLQNDVYNSTSYILSAEKDYDSYKNVVSNLLHPTGNRIITRNLIKSNSNFHIIPVSNVQLLTVATDIELSLIPSTTNYSNTFNIDYQSYWGDDVWGSETWGTAGASNLSINDKIKLVTNNNMNVYSTVLSIDWINDTVTLSDNIQYKFPSIYNGYTNSNTIIVMKENYPENKYSVNTFISIGDTVTLGLNSSEVINISNNILYFSSTLSQTGNSSNLISMTVSKNLTTNNISLYTTAV